MAPRKPAPEYVPPKYPTIYISVQGPQGQLVIDGPLDLLREFLALVIRDGIPNGGSDGTAPY